MCSKETGLNGDIAGICESALRDALQSFSASPRFSLLKALQPAKFFEGLAAGAALNDLTFEELAAMPPGEIAAACGSDEAAEALAALLNGLASGPSNETFDAAQIIPPELPPTDEPPGALSEGMPAPHLVHAREEARTKINSIEAERMLRSAFDQLQVQPFYDQVKDFPLKRYWDRQGFRDPFLEAMTFRQIVGMKISHLLEKRSFTQWKIGAVAGAIERCIGAHGGGAPLKQKTGENAYCADGPSDNGRGAEESLEWRRGAFPASPISSPLAAYFERQWRAAHTQAGELPALIAAVPEVFSAGDYVQWWLNALYPLDIAAELLHLSRADAAAAKTQLEARVREIAVVRAPVLHSHWQAVLSGPGGSEESLLQPYAAQGVDAAFGRDFLRAMLSSFQVQRPAAFGMMLDGYWTKNEKLLPLCLERVISMLPLAEDTLRAECSALMPLITFDDLKTVLTARARFDAGGRRWVPA